MTPTQSSQAEAARPVFEAWLSKNPNARFWNTTDAMLAAFIAGRAELASPQEVAAPVGDARRDEVMRHDYPVLQQFHTKHAMGPLAAPSCLCCGKSTQGVEIGVQHLELPGIVICKPCKDAAVLTGKATAAVKNTSTPADPYGY